MPLHLVGPWARSDSAIEQPPSRALKLPHPEERVAAARFLEYTNSQAALDVLLAALDDPDRQVQFAVMQSLGNLTSQHQWRPTTIESDSQWDACIKHWREFEGQRETVAHSGPGQVPINAVTAEVDLGERNLTGFACKPGLRMTFVLPTIRTNCFPATTRFIVGAHLQSNVG